jgi:hypothetical protein
MCETVGLPLTELMAKAGRVVSHVDGPFAAHVGAIRDFASIEMQRKANR